MKTFKIVNRDDEKSKELTAVLTQKLNAKGLKEALIPDYVIVVGGDGTFLKAVHQYLEHLDKLLFIGIHTGTLGFLNDYQADELETFIDDLTGSEPQIISYRLLRFDSAKGQCYSVNEMRIENIYKTQSLAVYANDEYVETVRGTGVCISGQLGSTAYNRSLGGSVIQNGLELLQLCEVTSLRNSIYRSLASPIIFDPSTIISLRSDDFEQCSLLYDYFDLSLGGLKEISIALSDKKLRIARFRPYNYNAHLRTLY